MSYSANQSAPFVPRAVLWNPVKDCQSYFEMIIIQFPSTRTLEIINIQFPSTRTLEIINIQFPNTRALWITNTNDSERNRFPVTLFYNPLKQAKETTLLPPKRTLNVIWVLQRKMLMISTSYKPTAKEVYAISLTASLLNDSYVVSIEARRSWGVWPRSPWFRHTKALSQEKENLHCHQLFWCPCLRPNFKVTRLYQFQNIIIRWFESHEVAPLFQNASWTIALFLCVDWIAR